MRYTQMIDEHLRMLTILTGAMLAGVVFFSGLSLLIHSAEGPFVHNEVLKLRLLTALLVAAPIVFILAEVFFARRMKTIRATRGMAIDQLIGYRMATVNYYAICELPTILGVMGYFAFADYLFFIPTAIGLLALIRRFPKRAEMESVLPSGY